MIRSLQSSLPGFKALEFHEGLNVLLSTRAPASGDGRTRNSAGKTSFVELIHFLLGADPDKTDLVRRPALVDHEFVGTFVLRGRNVVTSRSGTAPSRVFVAPEQVDHLGLQTRRTKKVDAPFVSNKGWKDALAYACFDFPMDVTGSVFGESYTPSFRSLLSYFARRDSANGFETPEKHGERQQLWDVQVNMSYLLGLDWSVPRQLKGVKDREKQLDEIRKAAKGGILGDVVGTVAELRPKVARAEADARRLRAELENFEVHEAYDALMSRAVEAKREIRRISQRRVPLMERIAYLSGALEVGRRPEGDDLVRTYQAIGIELPEMAVRRFEDVRAFHGMLIENRRLRLQEEVDEIQRELDADELRSRALDVERSSILRDLEGQGALSDFVTLQGRLADIDANAANLRKRFEAAVALEAKTAELTAERATIQRRLQNDHALRAEALDEAVLLVVSYLSELYEDRDGTFQIAATANGPEFRIEVSGDDGGGIASMEIFCLDLALFSIWSRRGLGPGFLIHDSHLFDGVDERQVAKAIEMGARVAVETGGQYIVTMNSDVFERLPLSDAIDRDAAVLKPVLSDADDTGGLFGMQFD